MKRVATAALLGIAAAAGAVPTATVAPPASPGIAMTTDAQPVRYAKPKRVASLNLCTDEVALLLAAPGQLVSVSRLGADPLETPVAGRAKGLATNRGRITDVLGLAPDLVLTSGTDGNASSAARRLGIAVATMPEPRNLADVRANVRKVAAALGRQAAGAALIARMDADLGAPSPRRLATLMIGGGGQTIAPDGLAAEWLRHAGLEQQKVARGRVNLDGLLARPPQVLLVSRYRPGQVSAHQSWLAHPALRALPASVRRVETDGRAWTCLGPALSGEISRLRGVVAQ